MIPLSLAEVADVVGGTVGEGADVVVEGPAYVDSRVPVPRGLFVAVAGEHVDGHDFAAGAHAVLGSRPTAAPTVVVPDPVVALGRLARHVLDRVDATVLALTGSQGKTGTKDYLAHVMAGAGATVATAANHNNELGVPLTVLRADAATRHLVVEMGARREGHIAYLCDVAPPRVGAVLNVGTAHLGEFGSREGIARAKGELLLALPPDGTAVVNADDELTAAMPSPARRLAFGRAGDVGWRAVEHDDLGRPSFEIGYAGRWLPVRLRQTGDHQVANATAAAAMALAAGLDLGDVAARLTSAEPASRWRMEVTERPDGLLVLDDTYNANPEAMAAAIATLARIGRARGRRTVALLGEMKELGEDHDAGHRRVGRTAAESALDVVVVVGEAAAGIAEGTREVASWAGHVVVTASRSEAADWVRKNARPDDVVLAKASRAAALDKLVEAVLADAGPAAEGDATTP